MKVVVSKAKERVVLIEMDEATFAFDPENYEMRRKYPPAGENGDDFAEHYKQQTPNQRAEEFAVAMVTEDGKHDLDKVIVTDVDGVTPAVSVTVNGKVVYDNAETVKQEVLNKIGW
jgi:hypothetical protein